jgi:hypothetical protein
LPIPIEIRPYVGTALAAGCAGETILNVGQSKIIRPRVAADGDRVAAAVVGAIDEQAAHAHLAQQGRQALLIIAPIEAKVKLLGLA